MVRKIKKISFLFILFYFLALLQTSFYLNFFFPNLIICLVILVSLIEKTEGEIGFFCALFGGFFLDIFSEKFIGFYILILIAIIFFIKIIIRRYFELPTLLR